MTSPAAETGRAPDERHTVARSLRSAPARVVGYLPVAVATTFGVQLMRVLFESLVGYLRDARGVGPLTLGVVALLVFATVFLAPSTMRILGVRRASVITGSVLALTRIAEQLVADAALDLVLSAVGVAVFLQVVVVAIHRSRREATEGPRSFGVAILVGIALDTALQLAGRTLDLSWQPGAVAITVVGVLAVALVGALWWSSRATAATADGRALAGEPSWAGVIGLVALGPWLALQLLVLQNVGFAASITGWSVPGVGVAMALANALGIGAATLATWHPRAGRALAVLVGIVGIVLVVGLSQLVRDTPTVITVARLAVLIALSFAIVGRLVDAPASDGTRPGMWRTSVAVGAGMLLFVVLVFVYYASYDLTLGVRSDAVVTIAAVLVAVLLAVTSGAGPSRPGTTAPRRRDALVAFGLAAVLAVVPMLQSLPSPEPTSATPPPRVVTVMSWNLHNAVNAAGRLDPEAIARVIEDSGADVVGLQEVSRGWLIWGGMDMLTWLADRLDMDHTWGPTADAQWGNAILSRHPLRDVVRASLPPDTLLLRRGHVSARIETAGGLLRVHSTHFTHVDDQHVERVRQAEVIRDAWAGAPRTVIVGDLNATPESEAIAVVRSAGLVDVAAAAPTPPGPTFPSTAPEVRIDYAFVSPDLVATAVPLAPTTASDHLPVAIRVEFP